MKYFALRSIFPLIVAIFFIFSCGGGGGGSDPIPLNPNTSPFFENNIGEVEVDEMQLSVVTISANDNDGDMLQYSLSRKTVLKHISIIIISRNSYNR